MAATFTFNGVDYTSLFVVSKITLPFNYQANEFVNVGRADGAMLQYSRYDKTAITIEGTIIDQLSQTDVWHTRQRFIKSLASKTPAPLSLSVIPGIYWNAIFDGTVDYDVTDPRIATDISLSFAIPEGRAWSTVMTPFTSTAGAPINVTYNGTAPSYPILTQTITGDNGLVGWVNDKGDVLQFGDPEAADGEDLTKSDRAIRWDMKSAPADATINTGAITPYSSRQTGAATIAIAGGVTFGTASGGESTTQSYTKVTTEGWHGPGIHGDIEPNFDADATGDFQALAHFGFTSSTKTRARLQIVLENAGTPAVTFCLRDSSLKANTKVFECWYGTKVIYLTNLNAKKFATTFYEATITRKGDTLGFKLSNIVGLGTSKQKTTGTQTYNATIEDFSAVPIDGVTLLTEQYTTDKVGEMHWSHFAFDWVNVPYWNDIPNLFEDGDVVSIDVGARKIYVNGVESGLHTIGNQWKDFAITESCTLEPVVSSWASPSTATVEVREAYL